MHAAWMLALWLIGSADKPPMASMARVRPTRGAEMILLDAAARSATVRDLLDRIAASDVIVYVELTAPAQVPIARTKLVAATPAARFLRVGINVALPMHDWAALLGHELQHAVEIAEHPDVRDDEGVRRLYASIGHQYGIDNYETDAAVTIERRVREELRHH